MSNGSAGSWRSSLVSLFAYSRNKANAIQQRDVARSYLSSVKWDPELSALAENVRAGILAVCESGDSARFEREVLKTFRSLILSTKLPDIDADKTVFPVRVVDELRKWMAGNGPRPEWFCQGFPWPEAPRCMTHASDAIVMAGFHSGWDWVVTVLSQAMVEDDISCGFGSRGVVTVLLMVYIIAPFDDAQFPSFPFQDQLRDLCEIAAFTRMFDWTLKYTSDANKKKKWDRALTKSWDRLSPRRIYEDCYLWWAAKAIADRWLRLMWHPDTKVGRRMVLSLQRRFEIANDASKV